MVSRKVCIVSMAFLFLLLSSCGERTVEKAHETGGIVFNDTVVSGGTDHFMEVHHVVIRGSNYEIGEKIAEIARRDGAHITPGGDPMINRIQREYIQKNYPIHYERMKGVASSFGIRLEDDSYDFSSLPQYPIGAIGCSVVFYPGSNTSSGHGVLSRNYDFTTGTVQGKRPAEGEMAMMGRPYLFEIYPDRGYASLSLCAFDLLGGVLEGINSEGLTVAVLGDDETVDRYGIMQTSSVGMHELLSMRYLLDTCRNVAEAKKALLYLKHFYVFMPCHYIIADAQGASFVFEFSPIRNGSFIVDGEGPQCVTNHLLSKYRSIDEFPQETQLDSYDRYRKLHAATTTGERIGIDRIKAINESVSNSGISGDHPDYAPNRTLWHSIYDITDRCMRVKFYLGEGVDRDGEKIIHYSDYIEFRLKSDITS